MRTKQTKKQSIVISVMIAVMLLLAGCTEMECEYTDEIRQLSWLYVQDNQIYYTDKEGKLAKTDISSKEKSVMDNQKNWGFNVRDQYLYKLTGDFRLLLLNLQSKEYKEIDYNMDWQFITTDDAVVYCTDDAIYQLKLGEKVDKEKLYDIPEGSFIRALVEYDSYLYFLEEVVETSSQKQSSYRINLKTGEKEKWEPFNEMIGVSEEYLYFYRVETNVDMNVHVTYDNIVYRIRRDGSDKEIIYEDKEAEPMYGDIRCVNGWLVYISSEDDKIYKMKKRGSENELLIDKCVTKLAIHEDTIFYTDKEGHLYSNNIYGSLEEKID